jgi:uncharacterized membrane protein YbhN (UPF0104 family)
MDQNKAMIEPDQTRFGASQQRHGTIMRISTRTVIRLVVLAFIGIYLLRQVDFGGLWTHFDRNLLWAAAAFQVPMIVANLFYARRHAILVRVPPIPLLPAFEAILLSAALNVVLPGRLSEVIKATYLRSRFGIPLPHGLSAILIERLFDLVAVGAIAATGIAGTLISHQSYLIGIPVAGLVVLFLLRPVSGIAVVKLAPYKNSLIDFLRRQCQHIVEVLIPRIIVQTVILTIISWLAHLLALVWFFQLQPFGALTLDGVALVFGALVFAGAIPALPAGIGMFEAAVVFVLKQRGFDFNQALALGIVLHAAELFVSVVLGPIVILRRSTGISSLVADALAVVRG